MAAKRCNDTDPYNRKGARLPKELCDTPSQTIYCCNREVAYIDPFFFTTSGTQYLLICIQTYYYDCTKLRCKSP